MIVTLGVLITISIISLICCIIVHKRAYAKSDKIQEVFTQKERNSVERQQLVKEWKHWIYIGDTATKYAIISVGVLLILGFILHLASLPPHKTTSYEDNVRNGMHKLSNGQYDDMTDEEKEAAKDFMEWQSEQNKKNK